MRFSGEVCSSMTAVCSRAGQALTSPLKPHGRLALEAMTPALKAP